MKKRKHWGMFISALLVCLATGFAWKSGVADKYIFSAAADNDAHYQGKEDLTGKMRRTVGVVKPRPVTGDAAITLPGRARASTQATLFFRVSAPLQTIHANPGDHVQKGDLLLELDDRDFVRQVKVIESQLKSARANLQKMTTGERPEDIRITAANLDAAVAKLELAQKELERHEILFRNNAVSGQAYDQSKAAVQSLGAQVAALEEQLARDKKGARKEDILTAKAAIEEITARLAIARDRLHDTRLVAPFDGVVTRRVPDAHEMVQQGAPVMVIDDISSLEIPVDVPETHIRKIIGPTHAGNTQHQFVARFLTTGESEYPAVLSEYSSRADPAVGTYEFVFTIAPDPKALLFPGMTAEIRVLSGVSFSQGIAVPLQCLMGVAGNSAHVFRVDPKTQKALRQAVTFETLAGTDEVKILTGLSPDDWVVEKGAAFVRQGETIQFDRSENKGASS